jgi:hypothetical protein
MGIATTSPAAGVQEVVIDLPPVNALRVADWFDLADQITAAGRDATTRAVVLRAEGRGFCAGVDIKELPPTTPRRPDRGEPRVLRRLRRGVRVRGAGRRRGAGLLPRRRHRPGRQRRRHRGVGRRDVRPARGRPGRARGGDPPRPPGPAAPDAAMVFTCDNATADGAAWLRVGADDVVPRDGSGATRPWRSRATSADQEPDDPAASQGVPERHRPGRREAGRTASSRASPTS